MRNLSHLLKLEHKYGDLQEKAAGMSGLEFRMLQGRAAESPKLQIFGPRRAACLNKY